MVGDTFLGKRGRLFPVDPEGKDPVRCLGANSRQEVSIQHIILNGGSGLIVGLESFAEYFSGFGDVDEGAGVGFLDDAPEGGNLPGG